MTVHQERSGRLYTAEEMTQLIDLASRLEDRASDHDRLNYEQVVSIAEEIGISPAALARAARISEQDRRIESRTLRAEDKRDRRYRRRLARFFRHLTFYATVAVGLTLLDWATGPGWWVEWFIFGWGTIVAIHGVSVATSRGAGTGRRLLGQSRY